MQKYREESVGSGQRRRLRTYNLQFSCNCVHLSLKLMHKFLIREHSTLWTIKRWQYILNH